MAAAGGAISGGVFGGVSGVAGGIKTNNQLNRFYKDNDVKFSVDQNTEEKFTKQVDEWLTGKMPANDAFELGETPVVLQALGAKNLPIIMSSDVMSKITGMKHSVALDVVKSIPQAIADPLMVFDSDTVNNAYVVLTELTDKIDNDIIVAIHLDKTHKHLNVNRVASVYGKENISKFIEKQTDVGNLKYIDKRKSDLWSQSRGLQLPKLADTINSSSTRILQKEDIVNKNFSTGYESRLTGLPTDGSIQAEDINKGTKVTYTKNGKAITGRVTSLVGTDNLMILRDDTGYADIVARVAVTPIDGGINNEQGQNLHQYRDGRRYTGENTPEYGRGLESGAGSTKAGQADAGTRRIQTENARTDGRVKTQRILGITMDVIEESAYSEDMKTIAEENMLRGVKTIFIAGYANNGIIDKIRGVNIGGHTVVIQYDNERFSPDQINGHELLHTVENSKAFKKAKRKVQSRLTRAEKEYLINKLYKDYAGTTKNRETEIYNEFLCDILSGMSEYTDRFRDIGLEYWQTENEFKPYSPDNYAHAIDGGGDSRFSTDEGNQFRATWTRKNDVLTSQELAVFYSLLADMSKHGYKNYQMSADGEFIFDIENKMVYTDGDYNYPTITKVIAVNSDDGTLIQYVKEMFYDGEIFQRDYETTLETCESFLGEGFVLRTDFENSSAYERKITRGKRSYSREVNSRSDEDARRSGTEKNGDGNLNSDAQRLNDSGIVKNIDNSDGQMYYKTYTTDEGKQVEGISFERHNFDTIKETKAYSNFIQNLQSKKHTNFALDTYRAFEQQLGKDGYRAFDEIFFQPFEKGKKAYMYIQEYYANGLRDYVVKECGIKPGSKESALVQQYGEGIIDETELRRVAPKKAENIIKAEKWFRNAYDSLIEMVNESKGVIYPEVEERVNRIKTKLEDVNSMIELIGLITGDEIRDARGFGFKANSEDMNMVRKYATGYL